MENTKTLKTPKRESTSRKVKTAKRLKTLTKKDHVSIVFGEWFDRTYGNTYFDADVYINDEDYTIGMKAGSYAGTVQAIDEVLAKAGYRVRTYNKADFHTPYDRIHYRVEERKKRDMNK